MGEHDNRPAPSRKRLTANADNRRPVLDAPEFETHQTETHSKGHLSLHDSNAAQNTSYDEHSGNKDNEPEKKPDQGSLFTPPTSLKAGHRSRLRHRFRHGGPDAMPDYELLELILFRAIKRRDTKDLAKRLLAHFGSFAEVINAPENRLKEITDVGDAVVTEFKLIHASALRLMKSQIVERPALSRWPQVLAYIKAAQAYENRELFRILFLDKRNHLIADEVQGQGTVDHTPVYIREVLKRALELSATAIILVHNHPSGDPTPSRADVDMTRLIVEAAKPLGITVHDHIIVGREGHSSLKALNLL